METFQKQAASDFTRPIRLIATDLDGTLLRPDGTISERTVTTLRQVREMGVIVVLVSSRPPRVPEPDRSCIRYRRIGYLL